MKCFRLRLRIEDQRSTGQGGLRYCVHRKSESSNFRVHWQFHLHVQDYELRWIRISSPTVTSLGKSLEQVRCDIRFVFEVSVQTEVSSRLPLNVPVRCAKMGRYNNRNLEHGGHGPRSESGSSTSSFRGEFISSHNAAHQVCPNKKASFLLRVAIIQASGSTITEIQRKCNTKI